MIAELLSETIIPATIALATLPLLARRLRTAFRPVELTRYNALTMTSGVVLLLAALVLCALPVVLALGGGPLVDRHFFVGEAIAGWVSAGVAVILMAMMAVGYRKMRRIESRLRIEPSIGQHRSLDEFDLVVLPMEQPLAYAVGGRRPQVVITEGLVTDLTVPELSSVIEHETAHITLNHRAHLTLIAMIEPLAWWIRPVRRLVDVSRLALERAADSCTTDLSATRGALLRLSAAPMAPGVAAFTAGDLAERLDALQADGADFETPDTSARLLLYLAAVALAAYVLVDLVQFWL